MPAISLVMGVYNCAQYVRKSIDSIIAQSCNVTIGTEAVEVKSYRREE